MKLKIAHRTILVRTMTSTDQPRGKEEWVGFFQGRSGVIGVCAKQPPEEQANTLIHEVLHALWFTQGLPDEAEEEEAVTKLANGLTQLLRDNPVFVEAVMVGIGGTPIVAPVEVKTAPKRKGARTS